MLYGTMTRTFKRYTVRIAVLGDDFAAKVLYEGTADATSMTKADARNLARSAGVEVPRGAVVSIVEIGQVSYEWSLEDIEPMAHVVE